MGQNGLINSAKLYNFVGNDSSDWLWQFQENVLAASFGNELELSIPKIEDTFKHIIFNISDDQKIFRMVWQLNNLLKNNSAWTEHTVKGL